MFNRGESPFPMTLSLKLIGAPTTARVRDLWERKDLGQVHDSLSISVPVHGVVMVRVGR